MKMRHLRSMPKDWRSTLLDLFEASITVVLAVALVLSLVWTFDAMAADVNVTWDSDEVGPPETFNVERKLTSVATPAWGALGTTAGDGGGTYAYLDAAVPDGIYRYRVNAENAAGASTWLESKLIMPTMTGNITSVGFVSASSSYLSQPVNYTAVNAIDGVFGELATDSPTVSWMPDSPWVGEWIQVDWASPVSIDQVMISGRSVIGRTITDCTVTFSDASSVPCGGPVPDNGDPVVLSFPTKTGITWVRMTIDAGTDYAGLDEIIVIGQAVVIPNPPTNVQVVIQ